MRKTFQFMLGILLVLSGLANPPTVVSAINLHTTADRVFGQPDFTSSLANNGGVSNHSLNLPGGVAVDLAGNLYVADYYNNRVLEYNSPLTSDTIADRVIGQPDFTTTVSGTSGISFWNPFGLALDTAGNLYVADYNNHRVLEFDTPLTSDLAADRVFGQFDFLQHIPNNGGVSNHSLAHPAGVALDPAGNLYVADVDNSRVLEYDDPLHSDRLADRVFGQPNFSANTGAASSIRLDHPRGVACDPQGNLYVADTFNSRVVVFKYTLTSDLSADAVYGQPDFISTASNNGGISASSLSTPYGIALDSLGNLYVSDSGNQRALEYDTAPITDTVADQVFGQPNFTSNSVVVGSPTAQSLFNPLQLTVDAQGDLYVADFNNSRVLEYNISIPGAPVLNALSPSAVAVGSPAFTLTVNGSGFVYSSKVRLNGSLRPTTFLSTTQLNAAISAADVTAGGQISVTVLTPAPGGGTSTPTYLTLYARRSGDEVADVVQGQPNFQTPTANNPLAPGGANRLLTPFSVAVNPQTGRLFVDDPGNNRVLSWSNAPAFANAQAADLVIGQPNFTSVTANTGGLGARNLNDPNDLTLDGSGNLYVADTINNRVLEYAAPLSNDMPASLVLGQPDFTSNIPNNGGVSDHSLNGPSGVVVDAQGNVYVVDRQNSRVLEFNTPLAGDANADKVFGQPDFTSNTGNNGGVSANSLYFPTNVAVDRQGNVYIADFFMNRVLEYDTPLLVLTGNTTADRVFGQPDFTTVTANTGGISASSLYGPGKMALDATGNLYVADYLNLRVLKYDAPLAIPSGNTTADRVFGQPDFSSAVINNGGISARSMYSPGGVALDAFGDLYVADTANNRVLEYDQGAGFRIFLPMSASGVSK